MPRCRCVNFARQNTKNGKETKQREIEDGHGRRRVCVLLLPLPTTSCSWIPQVVTRTWCAVIRPNNKMIKESAVLLLTVLALTVADHHEHRVSGICL